MGEEVLNILENKNYPNGIIPDEYIQFKEVKCPICYWKNLHPVIDKDMTLCKFCGHIGGGTIDVISKYFIDEDGNIDYTEFDKP